VELAPTILPSRLDRFRGDVAERGPKSLLARRVGVRDERPLLLFEALRVQLEQPGSRRLKGIGRDGDADPAELDPAQRKALFSLSKKPSSGR
jgi:hypothetical protein